MDVAALWKKYKASPSETLKQKIVLNYLKLVHYVIHHSRFNNQELLDDRDYFQFGIEGLSEAIDRFDPDYGTKFETYAIQRIRGKIIDELRKLQIKPRPARSSSGEEIILTTVSLNKSCNDDEGYPLSETIPSEAEIPIDTAEKNEAKELLIRAIKQLDERDRLIISLYYYEDLNYKEISETLNITVSRVSQVHTRIMNNLKKKLKVLESQ
jgi:RNA polymerase sigma factor for flagellar operon FliA